MEKGMQSFDPDAILKKVLTWIFGSSLGIIVVTFLLAAGGTTATPSLVRWVCVVGIGILIVSIVLLRKHPREFGLAFPIGETWRKDLAFVLAFTIPLMVLVARLPVFQAYYTVHYSSFWAAVWGLVGQTAIYYFVEEFLFHGFLFFGLLRTVGKIWSTILVSIVFTILHIGKPLPELLLAFIYSLIFCWLSYRSKSFFSAAAVHFIMSLVVNILVAYVWLGPVNMNLKF